MTGSVSSSAVATANRSRNITFMSTVICVLTLFAVLTTPAEASGMRLCGQKLTRTLQAVCANKLCGGFIESSISKRSLAPHPFDETAYDYFKHPHFTDLVFNDRRSSADKTDKAEWINLGKRDGIATQCCERKCTYAYLKTFCCEE